MDKRYIYHRGFMPQMEYPSPVPAVYDRTQRVMPRPEIVCLTPIGIYSDTRQSFGALCFARAEQIIAKAQAQGKEIVVSWSGGLDSTGVLLALMKRMDPSKIIVLMNKAKSYREYPWFYDNLIAGRMRELVLEESRVDTILQEILTDNKVLVTGEIGDQLFGSIKFMTYDDQADLLKPWDTILETVGPDTTSVYQKLVAACPRPITSVKDFWWWFNYVFKYQGVQLRMLLNSPASKVEDNVFHFFDTPAFNDWAVSTDIEEKYPGTDPRRYKLPLKKFILAQSGDANYYQNKEKERSLVIYRGNLDRSGRGLKTIDENWVRGY